MITRFWEIAVQGVKRVKKVNKKSIKYINIYSVLQLKNKIQLST